MLSFSAPQPRNQGETLSLFLLTELNFFEFQANFSLWIPNSAAWMPRQVMWFFSDRTRHRAIKGLSHGCFKSLMVEDWMIWVAWWLGHLHWFRIEVKLQWSFMFDHRSIFDPRFRVDDRFLGYPNGFNPDPIWDAGSQFQKAIISIMCGISFIGVSKHGGVSPNHP